MKSMIKPRALKAGDTVAAISLSWGGAGEIPLRYETGKRQLEQEFGLRLRPTANALRPAEWLDKNPQARADDLHAALKDPNSAGIISCIGGDDSIRLLPYLDLDLIRNNPKIFLGYSDTTVTHLAFFKAGVTSFYGPSILSGFAENNGMHEYSKNWVHRALFETAPPGLIEVNSEGWTVERLDWADPKYVTRARKLSPSSGHRFINGSKTVRGHLLGGCMDVLSFLVGTAVWPRNEDWDGAICFMETSEDAPSPAQLKYFLRQMHAIGALKNLNGFLLARPGGQMDPARFEEYDQVILKVLEECDLGHLAVVTNLDFGHTDPICTLPYGVQFEIDGLNKTLRILEAGVD